MSGHGRRVVRLISAQKDLLKFLNRLVESGQSLNAQPVKSQQTPMPNQNEIKSHHQGGTP